MLQDRKTGQGGPGRSICFNSGRKTWKLGQKMNADLFDDFDGLKIGCLFWYFGMDHMEVFSRRTVLFVKVSRRKEGVMHSKLPDSNFLKCTKT